MLQRVHCFIQQINLSLMGLSIFEHQIVVGACGVVAAVFLLFPQVLISVLQLIGIAAVVIGGYALYHLLARMEARDADYE
jgi:hypothetical protein